MIDRWIIKYTRIEDKQYIPYRSYRTSWFGEVSQLLTATDGNIYVLMRCASSEEDINHYLGTLNSGHPGGMLPLTSAEAETLHNSCLPDNLFVADASLLPQSLGLPPLLTIMALAKRISKQIIQ